ncbi:SusC/RagA family TonB-linked outer membrane protein [Dyadobacter sp. LHD-138]|uniref:SusC/RagA family TonB-linked outer membrane protein n=1 Tax=Dyadobacter sp. LHD-138 TaxID=3071413 RepID=UPI0027E0B65A|nr:SusC/RagA family TonB-linked outer membrane protein [Dyadobacter sp. LHD-138]MDQ6477146.1 SusC/RagA family TonB-linked outer membrane protein [Dyadobacter sp. LHD-138]
MKQKILPEHGTCFTSFSKKCSLVLAMATIAMSGYATASMNPVAPESKGITVRPILILPNVAETIKGKVTDDKGDPLPGVNILVKGTQQGTTSDISGLFSIETPAANSVLVFSFVGYQLQEVQVGNMSNLEIKMLTDTKSLNEVVVTALGIKKEVKSVGYSVTKIDGGAFTKTRETNIGNSLAGKVAGVNVSAAATGPAGSSRITIRGNTSIKGDNAPLFIINGLPMNNTQFGKTQGDNPDWGDNISSINPDDVEEMTVLKGAAAAALYGSRAKNGAIIITTKSGKGNKGIGIEFNTNNTVEVPYFIWQLQKEFGQGYNGVKPANVGVAAAHGQNHWGARYDGTPVVQLDGVERPYSYVKDQVLKDFYGNGFTSSNNIAFTGGGDKGNFRVAVTDMRNKGIIPNAKMRRDNISLSINQNATKNIAISANVDYINEQVDNRYVLESNNANSAGTILYVNSNMPTSALAPGYDPVTFKEKNLGTDLGATNPYYTLNQIKNNTKKDRFIAAVNARWNIFDWLFVQGKAGQDYFSYQLNKIVPEGTGYRPNGQIDQIQTNFYERNFEGMIGLNKALNKSLNLVVNLGGNMMSQHSNGTNISGSGIITPRLEVINNTSVRKTTTNITDKKINSLFGTAELAYKNYLFLNVTGRNDWFSTLSPESNNYFYPSASLSYVFSDAFDLPKAISFGKFRMSYASVGGDTDPYQLNLTYDVLPYSYEGKPLGSIKQAVVPNKNLRPLSVNELEAGLDLRLFNSKLGLDIAAYNRVTTNDITTESITTVTGYNGAVVTVGELRNRGVEMLLSVRPLTKKNFSWDVSLNVAYNKSKILKISNSAKELLLATATKVFIKQVVGEEYSQIVGRTIKRDANGRDVMDAGGLPIVPQDVKAFGSGIQRYTTGITNTFSYKALTLSAQVDGKFGGYIYANTNYNLEHRGMSYRSLLGRDNGVILPGVTEKGEENKVLVTAARVNNRDIIVRRRDALDDYLYNASFIKLRYVSLTYNLPRALYEKIGFIKGASVSLVGRNLQVLMKHTPGIDPESNLSAGNDQGLENTALPPTRSYGFNVNLKF